MSDAASAPPLWDYTPTATCVIEVYRLSSHSPTQEKRETTDPNSRHRGPGKVYQIPAGYRRVLMGFLREIEFMTKDKLRSHNCLFRAVYLTKVLDMFVDELKRIKPATPDRFRSRVLNPILQRQLRGVLDQEAMAVKSEVGDKLEEIGEFYLKEDPLDTRLTNKMLRNILYVWPVRLSLGYINSNEKCTETAFTTAIRNTEELLSHRQVIKDEVWNELVISDYEINIVEAEELGKHYQEMIDESVSSRPPL